MIRQFELVERVQSYDPDADEDVLNRAYVYGLKKHGTQLRASGDPYFSHPVEVAGILAEMKLDTASIVTGLLHDTIEDTDATRDEISGMFGEEIARLVDGVTKLSRLEVQSESTKEAENLRKLVLAMSSDIRVLLVKLADRLHNMRTLEHLSEAKRQEIAQETLEIYAPLANRIGIGWVKNELEDLCLKHLKPEIVCLHISAYGRFNERADWPGYDFLMQAEAGLMELTGDPAGAPTRVGVSLIDSMSGLTGTVGLLACLLRAKTTGRGCDVETCLYDVAMHQLTYPGTWYLNEGVVSPRVPRSVARSRVVCVVHSPSVPRMAPGPRGPITCWRCSASPPWCSRCRSSSCRASSSACWRGRACSTPDSCCWRPASARRSPRSVRCCICSCSRGASRWRSCWAAICCAPPARAGSITARASWRRTARSAPCW